MTDLDLNILKTITSEKVHALAFAYHFGPELFEPRYQLFSKLCIDYIKSFRDIPTRRTLVSRHSPNVTFVTNINSSFDKLENLNYNFSEYTYDLSQIKKRYQHSAIDKIRENAAQEDVDDPEQFFKDLSLQIQDVVRLDLSRSYTQKPVGDYVDEFQERYLARKLNPEAIVEINTGGAPTRGRWNISFSN